MGSPNQYCLHSYNCSYVLNGRVPICALTHTGTDISFRFQSVLRHSNATVWHKVDVSVSLNPLHHLRRIYRQRFVSGQEPLD